MRILLCHNYYQQPGGEDRCFADEAALLQRHGHTVIRYERNNDDISGARALLAAAQTTWNHATFREVRRVLREHQIDLVHCTNTFPVISPSIYYACHRENTPVVQSLHNYRLLCANSYFLRDQRVCEDCLGRRFAFPAVAHGCYRNNRLATLAVVTHQAVHRLVGSWRSRVDRFIALTDFARKKFIEGGLPAEKISVKPNFVDPTPQPGSGDGGFVLFAGRLSAEKGIELLLQVWRDDSCQLPLRIIGDGPLEGMVKAAAAANQKIEYLGFQPPSEVLSEMSRATCIVVPSLWYEGLPRTIVESLAVGTPVIASDLGPLADLVREDAGGLRFKVGDRDSLLQAVNKLGGNTERARAMRVDARREFLQNYTADANYESLMDIYASASEQYVR